MSTLPDLDGVLDEDAALVRVYQQIRDDSTTDRNAKLQWFCENVWARLEDHPPPTDEIIQGLISLLQHEDNLTIARLVLPDLRLGSQTPSNPIKQQLLQRIRPQQTPQQQRALSDEEVARFYQEEKDILHEAELYRAAILLTGRGPVSESQKEDIRRWLAAYPLREA